MPAYLDNEPLRVERSTIAAALRAAVELAGTRARVVVEATADGTPIADAVLQNPPETVFDGDLYFVSVEPKALVRTTLLDAADALDGARAAQSRSAELIQSGKPEESLAPLGEAIQTWQVVRDAVEKGVSILGAGAPTGQGLAGLVDALGGRLEEVKRSLTSQDWSALADTLAYDMDEQVGDWKRVLGEMAETLRPPSQGV